MNKIPVPFQAFIALILCSGMAWLVFVMAGFDPTPPTSLDLQARSTQDLSVVDINSTAVALAKQMVSNLVPSPSAPIFLPVTGKGTSTPTPQALMTLRAVVTGTGTSTPFSLFSFLFPPTATKKPGDPTVPPFNVPTQTLPPNTNTPSTTPVPASPTDPPTFTSTATKVPTATATEIPPPTPTDTQAPTVTPVDTSTLPPPTDTDTPAPPPPDTNTPPANSP